MRIVILKSAFEKYSKDTIEKSFKRPISLIYLARLYKLSSKKYDVIIEGKIIENWVGVRLSDDTIVNFVPKVKGGFGGGNATKSIIGIVAGIALSAGAFAIGKALAVAGSWTTLSYIAAAAVVGIGGMLMQSLTPKPKSDKEEDSFQWQLGGMIVEQGGALPVVYGKTKPQMTILSSHISNAGESQYLNMLMCPCGGPISSIENITLNNNPISNYKGVSWDVRYGLNNETVIPQVGWQYYDQYVGIKLRSPDNPRAVFQTSGNANEGLELTFDFPRGFYYQKDSGAKKATSITLRVKYLREGDTNWIHWGDLYFNIKNTNPFKRSYQIGGLLKGRYTVSIEVIQQGGTNDRHINDCYWSLLSGVMYRNFIHPGKALVAVRALATDQLSGSMPEVSCLVSRDLVYVFNPHSNQYEEKPANNPAWACYDIWHRALPMTDPRNNSSLWVRKGVPHEYLIYDEFEAWAAFCDKEDLKVNIYINTAQNKPDIVAEVATIGRGSVIYRGTKLGCVFDSKADMVQIFNVANIVENSFKETFMSMAERASVIEVSFYDANSNYESSTVSYWVAGWEKIKGISNPTQVRYNGITNRDQAYREAQYLARKNLAEVRTCEFSVQYEAIACDVGDVIGIQHDVPDWGFGGRILSGNTHEIYLDTEIPVISGVEYQLQIRFPDDSISIRNFVFDKSETIKKLEFSEELPKDPEAYNSIWVFGEKGKEVKPFRVLEISRSKQDLSMRTIRGIEYREEVYDGFDTLPDEDYSTPTYPINSLSFTDQFADDGRHYIRFSWIPPRTICSKFIVYINDKEVGSSGAIYNYFEWYPDLYGELSVKVKAFNYFGNFDSETEELFSIKEPAPPDVQNFLVERLADGVGKRFRWNYDYSIAPNGARFILKYAVGVSNNWDTAYTLNSSPLDALLFETSAIRGGTHTVMIKAVDNGGYLSKETGFIYVNMGEIPIENVLYEYSCRENGWSASIENGQIDENGNLIGIDEELMWDSDESFAWPADDEPFWFTKFKELTYVQSFHSPELGQLMIEAVPNSNVYLYYRYPGLSPYWPADNDPFWNPDNEPGWVDDTPWIPWVGKVMLEHKDVEIKAVFESSGEMPLLEDLRLIVDVPDITETLEDIEILEGGMILPITKQYREIKSITATIQQRPSDTAAGVIILSKNNSKPRLMVIDSIGNSVSGLVDIEIKGY